MTKSGRARRFPRGGSRWLRLVRLLRPGDLLIFAVAAAVVTGFVVFAADRGGVPATVEIRSLQGDLVYPLAQDREILVPGPLGETLVEIRDGQVRFVSSPCRDKICVYASFLSRRGQWAACLPNGVFVTITGEDATGDGPGVDASTF